MILKGGNASLQERIKYWIMKISIRLFFGMTRTRALTEHFFMSRVGKNKNM